MEPEAGPRWRWEGLRMKRIYISGAIAGNPQIPRTPAVLTARKELFYKGAEVARQLLPEYEPVSPLDVPACPDGRCVSRSETLPSFEHTWACYLRYDLVALCACDAIAMLPGWTDSEGAELELHVASKLGLLALYFNDDVTTISSKEKS
jgi:hypothetical protein